MNRAAREHHTDWLAPAPLWGMKGADGFDLSAPAVVRIDGDDFMDTFAKMLNPDPRSGATAQAALAAASAGRPDGDKVANVLYQPLHGCYALVCASLTCRLAGRPEKGVAPAAGDEIGFVLRRRATSGVAESAWLPAGSGVGAWVPAPTAAPVPGEELIPMFPVPTGASIPRRVWAGLVPTASRETYQPRGRKPEPGDPVPPVAENDPRLEELDSGPGAALQAVLRVELTANAEANEQRRRNARVQGLQALLGLATSIVEFVGVTVPPEGQFTAALGANPRTAALAKALAPPLKPLAPGLDLAWTKKDNLLGESPSDQPAFDPAAVGLPLNADGWNAIRAAVREALPKLPPNPTGEPVGPARPKFEPDFDPAQRQQYVVRCVYRRPNCPTVASSPSRPFAVAAAHEPGAPARTIRIPMPIDISVRGLRRFKRNVGFVLSEAVNARVQSLSGVKLKDLDDGNVPSPGIGVGEICSFALPIITLCAMIVMFIFLGLLNIVFFWLPLLKICLPVPKGKSP